LPGVLLEAMYCGAPVVSTDCPSGAGEILDGGRFGALVPVEDDVALADAILQTLVRRPPASVERAAQYNIDNAVSAYLKVLECPR
jgi:glycosyltransferase involved in cell wall biosynthesis